MSFNKLNSVMERVRGTIYGLYPQTYSICIVYMKSNKKSIVGEIDVRLLNGQTKRINVNYDCAKDDLEIKEETKQ